MFRKNILSAKRGKRSKGLPGPHVAMPQWRLLLLLLLLLQRLLLLLLLPLLHPLCHPPAASATYANSILIPAAVKAISQLQPPGNSYSKDLLAETTPTQLVQGLWAADEGLKSFFQRCKASMVLAG